MPKTTCPVCHKCIQKSEYLSGVFKGNPDGLAAATLVMHYRHLHLTEYDYALMNSKDKKTGYAKKGYEQFKSDTNNRAKRELIQALEKIGDRATISGFLLLADNDSEIVEFINKLLKQ